MDIDALRDEWMKLDAAAADLRSARTRLEARELDRRWKKARLAALAGILWEGVWGLAGVLTAGSFAAEHWEEMLVRPLGALPCLYVWGLSAAGIGISLWRASALSQAGPWDSVGEAQRRALSVEKTAAVASQWTLALGIPLWLVFPVFILQMLAGYSAAFLVDVRYLAWNLCLGSAAGGVLMAWMDLTSLGRRVKGLLFGREVQRLSGLIAEVEGFRAE